MKAADIMAGALTTAEGERDRKGIAFRVAVSAFLEDVAGLMQRADFTFRRLEDVLDKVHASKAKQPTASSTVGPPSPKAADCGLTPSEIAGMSDLVATDFDAVCPDSILTNPTVRSLLMQDGSWHEEAQLLSLGRRTLVDFLQRRAEHLQTRIGALLDVRYDPRQLQRALQNSQAAGQGASKADASVGVASVARTPRKVITKPAVSTVKPADGVAAWPNLTPSPTQPPKKAVRHPDVLL